MDFNNLLSFASETQKQKSSQPQVNVLKTKFSAPKKVSGERPKGVQSAAVRAFLEKQEQEKKKQARIEEEKKQADLKKLMALRTENNTHKRAHAMASRTKDNLKVFNPEEENAREEREQKMKEFLAKKLRIERGLGKDDENEKKTEKTSKHDHSVSKHSSSGDTHSSSSKHKSDRKDKDKSSSKHSKHKHDSHQREYNREDTSSKVHSSKKVSNKNEDVKSDIGVKKKPKVKNRPPQNGHTALNFNQLLALAKQKQFLPTDEPTKQERRDNDRPLTQDEKNQLEVDKERAAFRQSKEYKHWLKYGGERPQPSKRLDTAPIEAKKRNPHWHSSRRISEAYVNEADSDCDDGPPPVSKLPKIRKLGSQSQPVSKPYCSSGSESDQGPIPPSRQLSMAKKRKSTGDLGHGTARHGLSKHVKGRANYHSCSESDEGPIPPSRQLSIAKKGKSTGDLGHGTARHKGRTNDHSCSESDEGPIPPSRQLNMAKKRKSTGDLGHGTARHSLSKGRSNYENGTECDYEPKAKIIKKETTHKTSHSTLSNTSGKYSQSSANHKSPHRKHAAQTPSHKSHEKTSNHTSSNEKSSSHKSSHQRSSTHPVSAHKDSSRSRQSASKLNTQSSKHNPVNIKKEKTDTANIKKEKTDRRREEVRPVGSVKKEDVSMSKEKRDPGKLNLFPGKSFNKETIAKLQRMKGLTNKSNGVSSSQNSSSSGDRHSISSKKSVISKSTGRQSKPSKQLNTAQNVPSKKPPTSSTSKTKAASSVVKVKSETNVKSRPSQKPAAQSSRKQAAPSRIPDPGHRRTEPGPPLNPHMSTWDRIYGQIEKQHPKPVKKKKPMVIDSESEYDSEMDDFIDDDDVAEDYGNTAGEADYRQYIKEIFKYDADGYDDDEGDLRDMESNFSRQMKEEAISSKLGYFEDIEDMRKEKEELARKKAKSAKRGRR